MKKRSTLFLILLALALLAGLVLYFASPLSDAEPPADGGSTLVLLPEQTRQAAEPAQTDETVAQPTLPSDTAKTPPPETQEATLDKNGSYTSKEDVALYVHLYGELPQNFITKKEAEALGWTGGSLEPYAPGKSIGGSYFGNYEGLLPEAKGRSYTECDIDTRGKSSRGAKRIVFSNDGLIYYTDDHYESFELLYGEVD